MNCPRCTPTQAGDGQPPTGESTKRNGYKQCTSLVFINAIIKPVILINIFCPHIEGKCNISVGTTNVGDHLWPLSDVSYKATQALHYKNGPVKIKVESKFFPSFIHIHVSYVRHFEGNK